MGELKYPTRVVVQALLDNNGLVGAAARQLGCRPETIRRRIHNNAAIRQAVQEGRERLLDTAEERLMGAIMRDESWAIALVLKTLGKSRGYVERQEMITRNESLEVVTRVVRRAADDADSN